MCKSEWGSTPIRQNIVFTYKPVEFEKQLVQIQDFAEITDHFKEIYGVYL